MISLLLDIKDSLLGSVAVRLLRAKRGMRSLAKIIDSQTEEELLRNVAEFRKELEFRNTLKAVLERIEEIERKAASDEASLRDVWRFTHPLDAKWNYLNPLRANPSFQHWGVIVADVEKGILETVLSQRKWLKKMGRWCLGMIHELKRIGRDSAYQVRKWISNTIKKGFGITRVGQTALQNNEIAAKGTCFRCLVANRKDPISSRRTRSIDWERRIARALRSLC